MHATDPWSQVAASTYVSLGTYRRTGTVVATPVWIAADGDELVVTTDRSTGKVKRLRRDERVTLRPCDRAGKIASDAVTVAASARLDSDDAAGNAALAAKYGFPFRAIVALQRMTRRLQRAPRERVIIRITGPVAE
ncbi:PPOX class F420-dependent oxidoreductase [Microbacterium sp. SS28]|uniref:PPOX class F420-dependent oxidoreductase n=1 Tax=Microbacterium sp. SS28 TaxID=2919948 RepID=UPI001FAA56B2|nr:PPOX class F420-dependent oxidoreductase [Microbacterium sp. SS28]